MTPSSQFSTERLARLNTLFRGYVDRGELAGMSAIVAQHGETVYAEKFGAMDREANKPIQDNTIFNIASMTKPITSVAMMMLYEEGHFHLNTPISKFIPAFNDTKVFVRETENGPELADLLQPLTFRHLFTHTSGISYGNLPQDPVDAYYRQAQVRLAETNTLLTNKNLPQELAALPLAFQPGTKWRYGMNIDLLGALLELISGIPLDVFIQERILNPLGMTDTGYFVPPEKASRVATVYGHPDPAAGLQRIDDIKPPSELPPLVMGGAGLTSTLHDYARFAQMLTNGGELDGVRLLAPSTVALYSLNHTPAQALPYGFRENDTYHAGYGYSLGTRVLMDISKSGMYGSVGEFGWDGAFSTYFWIDPQEKLYGILMLQHFPNAYYPIHQQFKQLTYQAVQ